MRARAFVFALPLLLLLGAPAAAFSVGTGLTDWCHEQITIDAYNRDFASFPTDRIPLPDDEVSCKLARALDRRFGLPPDEPAHRFVFLSLVIGVRHPDTDGHSVTNIQQLRVLHASSEGQYGHALRRAEDDGPEGDRAAIEGTKALILREVAAAREAMALPPEEQVQDATIYLEFYGRVDVPVWAPAWHIGVALHALQDSFSHNLRTADLRTIVHVLNYADAVTGRLDKERDGLPHSMAMDACNGDGAPMAAAATEASEDFLVAVRRELGEGESGAVAEILAAWMQLEPGCDATNDFCATPWLDVARREPTEPFLEEVFDCSLGASGSAGGLLGGLLLLASFLLLLRRYSSKWR